MLRINSSLKLVLVLILVVLTTYAVAGKAQAAGFGFIQGTVKDSDGKELSGIYVEAFEVNFGSTSTGPGISQKTTDSAGRFSLPVIEGIYKVFFQRGASISYLGQWWSGASSFSKATPVVVPGGSTVTGIDATMAIASGGIITGQVTGPSGAAVQNVSVSVYDYDQPEKSWDPLSSGVTDINGNYVINRGGPQTHFPPGNYKIRCYDFTSGSNNQIEWWHGKTSFSTADPFVVTASGANKADCKLSEGGIITGTVTDASNSPIKSASVTVYDQNQSSVSLASASTDTSGIYTIKRLPSGNYKVLFKGPYGTNLASQWYANQASFNQASVVPVVAGSTAANINAQLVTGGTITGSTTTGSPLSESRSQSVTGGIQAGSPTAGITVLVYNEFQEMVSFGVSGADGSFSVMGLPAGKYKVEFHRYPDLGSTWFNGRRTFDSADWISVNAGSTNPDVNGQLIPAAIISGKVTDALGAGIPKVTVRVYDDTTLEKLNPYALTDSFGIYTLNSLSPGGGRLHYDSSGTGYFPEWWDDKKSITNATPINLLSGQTYSNKDALLDPSKEIYLPLVLKN